MHLFAAGELIRSPALRTAASGTAYATALLRVGETLVSVTAFDAELRERLLALRKGDPVTVSGRLQVNAYTDKSGEPKAGLSVTATEIMTAPARRAAAKPRPRTGRDRQTQPAAAAPFDDELNF